MKKPLIIFGAGDIAQLAHFYFCTDSNYEVVAFTVDAGYLTVPSSAGYQLYLSRSCQAAICPIHMKSLSR